MRWRRACHELTLRLVVYTAPKCATHITHPCTLSPSTDPHIKHSHFYPPQCLCTLLSSRAYFPPPHSPPQAPQAATAALASGLQRTQALDIAPAVVARLAQRTEQRQDASTNVFVASIAALVQQQQQQGAPVADLVPLLNGGA